MREYIDISYGVEDGYVGKGRDHKVRIYVYDLGGETAEEIEKEIDEIVEEDFRQNIYPYWDRSQVDFDLILAANKEEDEIEEDLD